MDNKYDRRAKRKKLIGRFERSVRKNGVYWGLCLCIAVIGCVTIALIASGNKAAERSYDQRLGEAQRLTEAPTSAPNGSDPAEATPVLIGVDLTGHTAKTPAVSPLPTPAELTPAPVQKTAEASENPMLSAPADGEVIRVFAMDCLIYSKTLNQWMTHPGVDIAAPKGAEVRCVAAGTVERVYTDDMLGVTVVIDHGGGMRTQYSNLREQPPVSEGQQVESRAIIGYIGGTAISECAEQAHLHFELYVEGVPQDPARFVLFPQMP